MKKQKRKDENEKEIMFYSGTVKSLIDPKTLAN